MESRIYHLHTLSSLHCGTGQSTGVIDLPIARDRATNIPLVPGSSLRGVLREEFAISKDQGIEEDLFGPRKISGSGDSYAGALALGDAHLLLLPVRSLAGIVAYITCPFVLKRYLRDCRLSLPIPVPKETQALHVKGNKNRINNTVVLEDLDLTPETNKETSDWANAIAQSIYPGDQTAQLDLIERFLIVPDSLFAYLAETATEIRTRIKINPKTGVVDKEQGALWYEENLPAESVLWGVYAISSSRRPNGDNRTTSDLEAEFPTHSLLQLGGQAGVGRGLVRLLAGGAQ